VLSEIIDKIMAIPAHLGVDGNNLYLFMGVKIGEFSVAAAYDILQGYEPNNFGGWLCVW
jgi:hypothetical protein